MKKVKTFRSSPTLRKKSMRILKRKLKRKTLKRKNLMMRMSATMKETQLISRCALTRRQEKNA